MEEVRVVDLNRGIERLATAEEVAEGIFYRDYEKQRLSHDRAARLLV